MKGETLQDTIRMMSKYVNILVLRHPKVGSAALAAKYSDIPVINAGDGPGEHPTQALLDMFCMQDRLQGGLEGKTIGMVGDLKYGRTIHSLSRLLCLRQNVKLVYVSPPNLQLPQDLLEDWDTTGIEVHQTDDLESVLPELDVLYQTRVQKERFADLAEYERSKGIYIITPDTMKKCKDTMLLMHPLPRVDEVTEEVDADPRAAYFEQARYGMQMRMAIMACLVGREGILRSPSWFEDQ